MRFISVVMSLLLILFLSTGAALAGGQNVTSDLLDVLKAKGVLDQASYDSLKKNEAATPAPAASTLQLLDVLKAKGVLNQEDYDRLSKEAAPAPAPVPAVATASAPAALPVAETVTAPAPAAAAVAEAAPGAPERPLNGALTNFEDGFARLSGDKVRLKIGAMLQAGWLYDDSGTVIGYPPTSEISSSSATKHIDNTFYVRRARLFFTGDIFEKVGFKISIEGANSPLLQDAYAWLDYIPYAKVTLGQFKTPFSVDQHMSIGDIPTINRSLVTNMIVYPELRDVGVMLSGAYRMKGVPFGVGYDSALFNGNGKNNVDDNNRKDWTGRAWINPFVTGLTLGGSWYMGDTKNETGNLPKDRDHQRWGADFEYNPSMVKGLKMMGEFEWERKYYDNYVSHDIYSAGTGFNNFAHTFGYYLEAWYRVDGLSGPMGVLNGFEPVVRYDFLDENTSGTANDRYRWTFGANYHLNTYTRLAVNWESIHAESGLAFNSLEKIDLKSHDLFTTMLQIKF
jgi:Phosphate-selective porin O and P